MSKAFSLHGSLLVVGRLLFLAVLLASVSNARAATFTYNFVDYPAYQADEDTGGTDTISGTIITDSNSGDLTTSDIFGGTFSVYNPTWSPTYGLFSIPIAGNELITGILYATPSSLTLPYPAGQGPTENVLTISGPLTDGEMGETLDVSNGPASTQGQQPQYVGGGITDLRFGGTLNYPLWGAPLPPQSSLVVATAAPAPEPATLTLLGSALLGLGVVYLRRRGARACGNTRRSCRA